MRTKPQIVAEPGHNVAVVDSLTVAELNQFMHASACEQCSKPFVAFNVARFCSPACMCAALGEINQITCIAVVQGLGWSEGAVEWATRIKPCRPYTVVNWADIVAFDWTDAHLEQMQIALKLRVHSYRRHHQKSERDLKWKITA